MPGHTVGDSLKQQTEKDLNKLQELVKEHDVIFLLTDSRESRWLPTLLGTANEKVISNIPKTKLVFFTFFSKIFFDIFFRL